MTISSPALHIGIASAIALVGAASIVYLYRHDNIRTSTTHEIKLAEDGFAPSAITIAKGDTVVFTTTRGKPFWPASDLHPTHGIYPEFDPRKPIDPDKSWSFRFAKAGEWRFHDHLDSFFKGRIIVQDPYEAISTDERRDLYTKFDPRAEVRNIRTTEKDPILYINYHLDEIIQKGGIDGTVAVVMELFRSDTVTIGGCHSLLHLVGHKAYGYFKGNMQRLADIDWQFCGGAYEHGVEAQIAKVHADPVRELARFCMAMRAVSSESTPCYHGAGHAFMEQGSDIGTSLSRCDGLMKPTEKDLSECHKGVFSEYAFQIEGVDGDTGLPLAGGARIKLTISPLEVCQSLAEQYHESCGLQLSRVAITGHDFPHSVDACLRDGYAANLRTACVQNMAAIFAQRELSEHETLDTATLAFVRTLDTVYRHAYMRGALGEFRAFGQTGRHKDWTGFCASFSAPGDREYCDTLPATG